MALNVGSKKGKATVSVTDTDEAQGLPTAVTQPVVLVDIGYTRELSSGEYIKPRFAAVIPVDAQGKLSVQPSDLDDAFDQLEEYLGKRLGAYVAKATGEVDEVPWDTDDPTNVSNLAAVEKADPTPADEMDSIFDAQNKEEAKPAAFESQDIDTGLEGLGDAEDVNSMPIEEVDEDDPLGLGLD